MRECGIGILDSPPELLLVNSVFVTLPEALQRISGLGVYDSEVQFLSTSHNPRPDQLYVKEMCRTVWPPNINVRIKQPEIFLCYHKKDGIEISSQNSQGETDRETS